MARINVEESIWSDARFRILSKEFGDIKAIGMLVVLWRTGLQFFMEKSLIPEEIFSGMDLSESLITLGFARRLPEGIEVAGSGDHFGWAMKLKESHSKAGKASWEARKSAGQDMSKLRKGEGTNAQRTPNEQERTPTNALTPSLTLTLTQEELNTVGAVVRTSDVEKVADATLSPQRKKKLMVEPFPMKLESVDQLLTLLPKETLLRWSQLYDDKDFLRREVTKAFGYYVQDNPKKCPKNKVGWCRALSSWFERGWSYRAKGIKGKGSEEAEADAFIEKLKAEEAMKEGQ